MIDLKHGLKELKKQKLYKIKMVTMIYINHGYLIYIYTGGIKNEESICVWF